MVDDSEIPVEAAENPLALTLILCYSTPPRFELEISPTAFQSRLPTIESTINMLRTNDPLAVLGDLELDLVLSFLSIPETIIIRGVSTLWKARVDFRLTSSAIRRYYPTAEEAQTIYRTRDEEALAFRKAAYRHETREEPSMALVFPNSHCEVPWYLCNDHMVRTDIYRECLYIQRVFDPKNPRRKHFPVKSLIIKNSPPLRYQSRNGLPLKVQWITGHDTDGIIVLHVGVDYSLSGDQQTVSHPRWTLAISVASGKFIWSHKAKMPSDSHWWGFSISGFRGSTASLGHGNACIVDIGGNLAILDLATGQEKVYTNLPNHRDIRFSTPRGQSPKYNLTAHPTMEFCFAIMRRALSVISTKTARVVKILEFDDYLPKQSWSWTRLHFGKKSVAEGGGERAWLLCDAWNFSGTVWMSGPTAAEAVVSYEIDLEKLELVQVAVWKIAHHGMRLWTVQNSRSLSRDNVEGLPADFEGAHLRFLNPVTKMGCICVGTLSRPRKFQLWTIKFKKTGVILSRLDGGKYPLTVYEVEDHQNITLPENKSLKKGGDREAKVTIAEKGDESSHPRRRREFIFTNSPKLFDSYFSENYIAFTTGSGIYLFGFMPRW